MPRCKSLICLCIQWHRFLGHQNFWICPLHLFKISFRRCNQQHQKSPLSKCKCAPNDAVRSYMQVYNKCVAYGLPSQQAIASGFTTAGWLRRQHKAVTVFSVLFRMWIWQETFCSSRAGQLVEPCYCKSNSSVHILSFFLDSFFIKVIIFISKPTAPYIAQCFVYAQLFHYWLQWRWVSKVPFI